MNETTRILWSGLTGRTGMEAIQIAKDMTDVDIVAGMSRRNMAEVLDINGERFERVKWYQYSWLSEHWVAKPGCDDCDVLVDFSHPSVFDKVLDLAVHMHVPLISGTSGLSDYQMAALRDATKCIPIFRGGNFRFKVKKFIDEAVELAQQERGKLDLYENFYKGKSLPSETAKVIQRKIMEATGRTVTVHSSDTFGAGNLICDWEFQVHRRLSPTAMDQKKAHCRTIGFDELAHDVLEIAKAMKNKPIKKGEFYDLDEIWDDIPKEAKTTA